jgi:hypothetical protein
MTKLKGKHDLFLNCVNRFPYVSAGQTPKSKRLTAVKIREYRHRKGTTMQKYILPALILISLVLAACAPVPVTKIPSTLFTPVPSIPFPQTRSVNGLEVELLNARILDGQLTIDLCHQLPTQEDWIFGNHPKDVFVTVGGKKIDISGFGILYYRTSADTGKNTHRCDALNFPVSDPGIRNLMLTINEFYTSVPEVPDCDEAQKKLDAAEAGIQFTCNSGPGFFSYDITQKPSGMSENDARMIVFDAFSSHVKGPWVFKMNLPIPLVKTTSTPWPTPAGIEPIDGQMTTASGVDVLVTGNLVDGSLFQVDVCYIPPTKDSAWALAQSPQDIILEVAGQTYPVDYITYTGWENDYGFPHISERYRCHRLSFTTPADADTSAVTLHINKLYKFPVSSGCDKTDIAFKAGKITNAACSSPASELAGPWVIQTGLPRR